MALSNATSTAEMSTATATATATSISAAAASSTAASSSAAAPENDGQDEEALNTTLRSCGNDPDFAVICAFLQKFSKDLGIELSNFRHLQEWLTNTDEVSPQLRDVHIKLLRKTRKTVHEKSWESSLSKFCFTYSVQDAWEVERFGYKKSSLKVKLRILRELLESQFERNAKFRSKLLTLSADSLRAQPIGRDRLGHAYWFTQDEDCNLRIYQEHLDEEIWQVVATNREEFVNLIARLRGNEVVLPSMDIGVIDEDTSSSNSCNGPIEKPPPPEEQDDSQEEEPRVPNLRIKLNGNSGEAKTVESVENAGETGDEKEEDGGNEPRQRTPEKDHSEKTPTEEKKVKPLLISQAKLLASSPPSDGPSSSKKRTLDDVDRSSPPREESTLKKSRPTLLDSKRTKNVSKYEEAAAEEEEEDGEEEEEEEEDCEESEEAAEEDDEGEEEDIDSAAADNEDEIETNDSDEEEAGVGDAIEDPPVVVNGEGSGAECEGIPIFGEEEFFLTNFLDDSENWMISEAIEEEVIIVRGDGTGSDCQVGNTKAENNTTGGETPPREPRATFFFGEPGCLKLSPMKNLPKEDDQQNLPLEEGMEVKDRSAVKAASDTNCKESNEREKSSEIESGRKEEIANNENVEKLPEPEIGAKPEDEVVAEGEKTSNEIETQEQKIQMESKTNGDQEKSAEREIETSSEATEKDDDNLVSDSNRNSQRSDKVNENTDSSITEIAVAENHEVPRDIVKNNGESETESHNHIVSSVAEAAAVTVAVATSDCHSKNQNSMPINNREEETKENIAETFEQKNGPPDAASQASLADQTDQADQPEIRQPIVEKEKEKPGSPHVSPPLGDAEKVGVTSIGPLTSVAAEAATAVTAAMTTANAATSTTTVVTSSLSSSITSKLSITATTTTPTPTPIPIMTLPSKTTTTATTITTTSLPNRKRRLADFAPPPCVRQQSTSESEIDIYSENQDDAPAPEDDPDEMGDVGGKRQKLRSKQTNSEMRKKIEAQKGAALEETTSSSGQDSEEETRKCRKMLTPSKRQIDSNCSLKGTRVAEEDDKTKGDNIKQKEPVKETAPLPSEYKRKEPSVTKTKPTLDEIIEKKLRKNSAMVQNKIETASELATKSLSAIVASAVVAPARPLNAAEQKTPPPSAARAIAPASGSEETFSPPKKSPITKPLKKNLLTQLRQEESDEEAIPRKRSVSDDNIAVGASFAPMAAITTNALSEPVATPTELLPVDAIADPAQSPESRRRTPDRNSVDRTTPERQRKRRSSEELKENSDATASDQHQEGVSEKLKKNNDADSEFRRDEPKKLLETTVEVAVSVESKAEVKVEESPPEPARRSSRRGGAAVVYSELPQTKRTRAVAKGSSGGVAVKKAEDVKVEEVKEIEPEGKEAKEEENAPEVKPLAKAKTKKEKTPEKKVAAKEPEADVKIVKEEEKQKEESEEPAEHKQSPQAEPSDKSKAHDDTGSIVDSKEAAGAAELEELSTSATASASAATPATDSKISPAKGRGSRKKREVDTSNIIETTETETPVRQSRRIAQQKIREEAERRKLEEIALRSMKQELKKKKKAEKQVDPTVVEPESEQSSSEEEESEVETKKKAKKKCPGKDGTWSSGSEEQEEPEEDDLEPPHEDTDPGSPLFRSDHEFSPESDLEDESQVVPMKRARTARKEDAAEDEENERDEEACQMCGKSDHPEWILLCDTCDKGYHCSCLSPVLFYIPEGDWYCPPCQQEQLIAALERQLQVFDDFVERKRIEDQQRLAEEAERAERERLEMEEEQLRKESKKRKQKSKGGDGDGSDGSDSESDGRGGHSSGDSEDRGKGNGTKNGEGSDSEAEERARARARARVRNGQKSRKKTKRNEDDNRRRRDGRSRRRAATRGARQRRRNRSESGASDSGSDSDSASGSSSTSSSATDSDDEPIYKLRKRRQINVSYRLNEFDDLINSALKKEMDEVAGAGNLGRGKDITTIIEADKEEKARQKQLEDGEPSSRPQTDGDDEKPTESVEATLAEEVETDAKGGPKKSINDDESDDEPLKKKVAKPKAPQKKKPRKLTTLDISSEEDDASDEDFKTSSMDDEEEEDEDTSISASSDSDSSLEVYRRRSGHGGKKQRKAARRAARERRKMNRFVVEDTDDDADEDVPKTKKKKRKQDSDYTESETGNDDDDDLSEISENVDSADLCDDTTSEESDGAWQPSKRKKQKKSSPQIARKSPKLKKTIVKKQKRLEYSDDDISESEPEDDDDDGSNMGGKGSGKQPRSQPLKQMSAGGKVGPGKSGQGQGKGKGKTSPTAKKKKKHPSEDEESFSDSGDSARRTRGRRYAYLEDFDDDSSDGGIKPGVKRPDTPPEEREKFIQRQEEIKRMLAEKNAEGAKLAATPRLTPIKGAGEKEKRSPAKAGDSLSTVPLSVIRQAKVLDIDYLQRKGEPVGDIENDDDVDEFDDADLPDDLPEDMDEEAIARMVDEEEEFSAAAVRELPAPDEVLRTSIKSKMKEFEKILTNPSLVAMSQMQGGSATTTSGLQEALRKRLPMPTIQPPLLRHQSPGMAGMPPAHLMQRMPPGPPGPPGPPTSYLLQNALSAPLSQSLSRNFPTLHPAEQRMPGIQLPPHLMPPGQPLPATQSLRGPAPVSQPPPAEDSDAKPRGRRKKITPLRDALQKQQTAAAVSAAQSGSTQEGKPDTATSSIGSLGAGDGSKATTSVTSTLTIAQPPQMYKHPGVELPQPSVITRMPHLPPHSRTSTAPPSSGPMYPSSAEVARLYGPQPPVMPGSRQILSPSGNQRHRLPPQMPPGMPSHHSLRPTYGPPPPLRGGPISNHGPPPPPTSTSGAAAGGLRPSFGPIGVQAETSLVAQLYGTPPPARHAPAHLNSYRPPIYGNPNFTPRGAPPNTSLRPGIPHIDYASGGRGYAPFGYYPPPPPLTTPTAHQQTVPPLSAHTSSVPSSVIVSAPSAAAGSAGSSQPSPTPTPTPTSAPHPVIATIQRSAINKSPSPTASLGNGKDLLADHRKKLTTLEAYPTSAIKSPLAIGGESSGSRSSPGMQPDGAEDSSSATATSAAVTSGDGGGASEGQASEFSGLVSYFSSQHDDYNT